jgi:hypothetical protein
MGPVVFLSTPSVLTFGQERSLHRWHQAVMARGFRIQHLRRERYEANPWQQLRDLFDRVDGALVLGMRQIIIETGVWRIGTVEQTPLAGTWTSPWLQIETGMAMAANIPVLVVPEGGVCEGVFAPENWQGDLYGAPIDDLNSPVVDVWASAVMSSPNSVRGDRRVS